MVMVMLIRLCEQGGACEHWNGQKDQRLQYQSQDMHAEFTVLQQAVQAPLEASDQWCKICLNDTEYARHAPSEGLPGCQILPK